MESNEMRHAARTQAVRDLGRLLRRQARARWSDVRVARRGNAGHQVWRFRPGADDGERFLHVSNEAIDRARSSGRLLFRRLREGDWLSRLDQGGEIALRLGVSGKVESYPR